MKKLADVGLLASVAAVVMFSTSCARKTRNQLPPIELIDQAVFDSYQLPRMFAAKSLEIERPFDGHDIPKYVFFTCRLVDAKSEIAVGEMVIFAAHERMAVYTQSTFENTPADFKGGRMMWLEDPTVTMHVVTKNADGTFSRQIFTDVNCITLYQ